MRLLASLKEYRDAMHRTQKPTQKLKHCFCLSPFHKQSDNLYEARKIHSSAHQTKKQKNSLTKPEKLTRMQIGLYESGWRETVFNDFQVGNDIKTVREQKKVPLHRTLEK